MHASPAILQMYGHFLSIQSQVWKSVMKTKASGQLITTITTPRDLETTRNQLLEHLIRIILPTRVPELLNIALAICRDRILEFRCVVEIDAVNHQLLLSPERAEHTSESGRNGRQDGLTTGGQHQDASQLDWHP